MIGFELLILIAVGAIVVRTIMRIAGREASAEPETTGFFLYLAMFAALLTFAIGLTGVVSGLIDRPTAGRAVTAGELSSTVIGLPVFLALARTTLRRLRSNPAERGGSGWSAYINVSLLTTLLVSLIAAFRLLTEWVDGGRIGNELGLLLVWFPLWMLHWRVWSELGDDRRPQTYWLLASTLGVGWLVTGGVWALSIALQRVVAALAGGATATRTGSDLEQALIVLGLGAVAWWWHWIRTGSRREDTTAGLVYLLIVGVFGGLVTFYVGAVGALTQVLVWFFGDPDTTSGRLYFEDVARLSAVAVGGAVVWWYHRTVLGPRRDSERTEVDRLYDHLIVGLAALVTTAALITLGVVVLSLLAPATAVSRSEDTGNIVLAAISLLLFGAPAWVLRWRELQARCAADETEARSPTRRFYLLLMLGLAGTAAFIAGIVTLAVVLGGITGERTGSVVGNLRVPLAILVGAGALGWYHLRLYLAERDQFTRPAVREITLVVPAGVDISDVEALPGLAISRMDMAPDGVHEVDADQVEQAIAAVEGERLLAIVRADGIETIRLA